MKEFYNNLKFREWNWIKIVNLSLMMKQSNNLKCHEDTTRLPVRKTMEHVHPRFVPSPGEVASWKVGTTVWSQPIVYLESRSFVVMSRVGS